MCVLLPLRDGVHYQKGDLYAPVMKAFEVRLMVTIAAQHKCKILKTNNFKQEILSGDI